MSFAEKALRFGGALAAVFSPQIPERSFYQDAASFEDAAQARPIVAPAPDYIREVEETVVFSSPDTSSFAPSVGELKIQLEETENALLSNLGVIFLSAASDWEAIARQIENVAQLWNLLIQPPQGETLSAKTVPKQPKDVLETLSLSRKEITILTDKSDQDDLVPGRILVGYEPGTDVSRLVASVGAKEVSNPTSKILATHGVRVLEVPAGKEADTINILLQSKKVRFAEREGILTAVKNPVTDPLYSQEWWLGKMWFDPAWLRRPEIITSAVTIAILDSGQDLDHPDRPQTLIAEPAANFVDPGQVPEDENCGHGTMVTGMAAAPANGIGIVGVCPDCPVMVVKIGYDGGTRGQCFSTYSLIASGIYYAVEHGAKVVNISYSGLGDGQIITDAVTYATQHGVIVVAAAGNDGDGYSQLRVPCGTPGVICVSAITQQNQLASWSNWGKIEFTCPGSLIKTTTVGGGWGYASGTSFASPCVAGAMGFTWSDPKNVDLTRQQLLDWTRDTALGPKDPPGTTPPDQKFGAGVPNLYQGTVGPLSSTFLPAIKRNSP